MSLHNLELGIDAVQKGNYNEALRLLRIAIKSGDLPPKLQATAYLWLAECGADAEHKRACYNDAIRSDPNNQAARERLAALLEAQLPPPPDPTPPAPPGQMPELTQIPIDERGYSPLSQQQPPLPSTDPLNDTGRLRPMRDTGALDDRLIDAGRLHRPRDTGALDDRLSETGRLRQPSMQPRTSSRREGVLNYLVGIIGAPNGTGSAFFVDTHGMLATTRHVVCGEQSVIVEIEPGRQVRGEVVRAYPEIDLALIQVEEQRSGTLPVIPYSRVPDSMALVAVTYDGRQLGGSQRPTRRAMAGHWIPTTFVRVPDAGGCPIFDEQGYLVGMLTRNGTQSSNYVYGVHIATIRRCLEYYYRQQQPGAEMRVYCTSCGTGSRALAANLFYCEVCGAVSPRALNYQRYPLPQAEIYYGATSKPCPNCKATVGYYRGECLRCGYQTQTPRTIRRRGRRRN